MSQFRIQPIRFPRRALPLRRTGVTLLVWITLVGCSTGQPSSDGARIERIKTAHLPNAVRIHPNVVSGGLPDGEQAFLELKSLGIKTIISVDGARPDVSAATRHGMRYVHLPHGYDGVPENRFRELAKAVRDLPGPIYIHCHHGRHRSPAAAAVACVGAGLIERQDALTILKVAVTDLAYLGLFQAVETAYPLDEALLDNLPGEFPTVARLPAIAEAMVEMDHRLERLQAIQRNGWVALRQQPNRVPAHEALLLSEHFKELMRLPEFLKKPADFHQFAWEGLVLSERLQAELNATIDAEQATRRLAEISNNCKGCHERFRDRPQIEKDILR
ncbi:MAG: hypothetical protein FJ295_15560 [Planctomycetes bacterium]|nr:hypothetical protein [Planctomycetota bacterium]